MEEITEPRILRIGVNRLLKVNAPEKQPYTNGGRSADPGFGKGTVLGKSRATWQTWKLRAPIRGKREKKAKKTWSRKSHRKGKANEDG